MVYYLGRNFIHNGISDNVTEALHSDDLTLEKVRSSKSRKAKRFKTVEQKRAEYQKRKAAGKIKGLKNYKGPQ